MAPTEPGKPLKFEYGFHNFISSSWKCHGKVFILIPIIFMTNLMQCTGFVCTKHVVFFSKLDTFMNF